MSRIWICVLVFGGLLAGIPSCRKDIAEPESNEAAPATAKDSTEPRQSARTQREKSTSNMVTENDTHARGKAAWAAGMCAKCHTRSGKGGPRAPDLTDHEWFHCDGTIEGIRGVLVSGVPREKFHDPDRPFAMNPVTNLVPDEKDLDALAVYVHSLSE